MSGTLQIDKNASKVAQYEQLKKQLSLLVDGENDVIANLGNIIAGLHFEMNWFWTGLYRVDGDQLVLSVFQGPIACTRIHKGRGVCGKAFETESPILVPNVNEFEGHIACSTASKSEVVIPIYNQSGKLAFILDVDSDQLDHFDQEDVDGLINIGKLITKVI